MTAKRARNLAFSAIVLIAAAIWIFPLYWALTTSLRSENRIISDAGVLIDELNFSAYIDVLSTSKLPLWYLNSVGTSVIITVIVLLTGMMCAYALSQLRFPGRQTLYLLVVASFMVPVPALYVAQFVLMNDLDMVNTWWGIILPQLIVPVVVIVYKQFFDAIPREMREAVLLDGGDHHLHLGLEQFFLAVPGGHQRGHDDHPGRHYPGHRCLWRGLCPDDGAGASGRRAGDHRLPDLPAARHRSGDDLGRGERLGGFAGAMPRRAQSRRSTSFSRRCATGDKARWRTCSTR